MKRCDSTTVLSLPWQHKGHGCRVLRFRVKVIGTIVAHIKRVHCGVEHGRVGIVVGNHAAEGSHHIAPKHPAEEHHNGHQPLLGLGLGLARARARLELGLGLWGYRARASLLGRVLRRGGEVAIADGGNRHHSEVQRRRVHVPRFNAHVALLSVRGPAVVEVAHPGVERRVCEAGYDRPGTRKPVRADAHHYHAPHERERAGRVMVLSLIHISEPTRPY